jgi:hypothetical protein
MKNVSYKIVLAIILLAAILPASAQKRSFLATAQYAGSIGYLSVGGGITSRNHKFHNELLYGFVPSYYGGPLNKVSYKLTYYPLQLKIGNTVQWQPVSIGGMLSYNLDKGFTMVPSLKSTTEIIIGGHRVYASILQCLRQLPFVPRIVPKCQSCFM